MRRFWILAAAALLGGCGLDAKPMTFTCGDMLTDNAETYQPTPLFAEIQRYAGRDECPTGADGKPHCNTTVTKLDTTAPVAGDDPVVRALDEWRESNANKAAPRPGGEVPVLMLSGGGLWGSYGAGFLNELGRSDWAVVTGISTGAMEGLFVAAGDYKKMEVNYSPAGDSDLATSNGVLGLISKGSQYDLAPLRKKIFAYLLPTDGSESPLRRMIEPGHPDLFVAMVEARSGDLKVVHITRMVRRALVSPGGRAALPRVAECVAGIALASSSIPVRLTPVEIDGHDYMDGGVRASVFDAGIGNRISFAAGRMPGAKPHLYVIRNGPTIVFRDKEAKGRPRLAAVDARPDAYSVGMRGYSTIVNESELMSIASLRLRYPDGPIDVTTADGFNAPENPEPCGARPDEPFNAGFMRCLVKWGHAKTQTGQRWIRLSNTITR